MKLWVPVVKFSLKPITLGGVGAKPVPASKKQVSLPYWRWIVPAAAVMLFLLAGYGVWHSLGTPNHGTVAIISPDISSQTKLPEYTTLTTSFYSLNYSLRYSQVPADIPAAGLLDQKILAYKLDSRPGQSKIEVDIKAAPDGGITLDSNYDYYIKHLSQYRLSVKYYHGEAIDIARSTKGPPETAGLWLHGSWLMIAKITTADPRQNIDGELKDLLSSVQWREE